MSSVSTFLLFQKKAVPGRMSFISRLFDNLDKSSKDTRDCDVGIRMKYKKAPPYKGRPEGKGKDWERERERESETKR